jgi:hypothetical protein
MDYKSEPIKLLGKLSRDRQYLEIARGIQVGGRTGARMDGRGWSWIYCPRLRKGQIYPSKLGK